MNYDLYKCGFVYLFVDFYVFICVFIRYTLAHRFLRLPWRGSICKCVFLFNMDRSIANQMLSRLRGAGLISVARLLLL